MRNVLFFVLLILGGCQPIQTIHGNYVQPQDVDKVKINQSTKKEVRLILGPPSFRSSFGPDQWIYIGDRTEEIAFKKPEPIYRKIFILTFNDKGVVTHADVRMTEGNEEIEIVEDLTPTLGRDPSLFKELFGSIGKYDEGKHRPGFAR